MAKNTDNNRISVKWVRDKAKAAYEKASTCYICSTNQDLELHHLKSITLLLNSWAEKKKYDISTDAGILAVRDEFIAEHHEELYNEAFTLCNKHHIQLHGLYGKKPALSSSSRQKNWIEIQRAKIMSGENVKVTASSNSFSSFY